MRKKVDQVLEEKKELAFLGGGKERINKQHQKNKLTARERIDFILDEGSFEEIGMFVTHRATEFGLEKQQYLGDGVITGYGKIDGRSVVIFAQDFTVFGGSLSETHAEKIVKAMDLALKSKIPIIGLNDSGGARIQEGVRSLAGYADIFKKNVDASGVIPQISAIMGPCAGGAVYSPAMTDFTIMVQKSSYMFVTGPNVVKTVTNETVTSEELGGADTHATKSGVTHFTASNDMDCLLKIKKLLSYLPNSFENKVPELPIQLQDERIEELEDILPNSINQPYDIVSIIELIVDKKSFLEVHKDFAENIVVGFARIGGKSIGIVANQPIYLAGCLDVKASQKGARFVRFCDSFNIPLIVLEDVPGFLPGTDQEWNAIITNGAKLLYAFSEATVARITIIIRKAYGGAYDVMNSKHIGADFNFAWPSAEIAVMGAKGASEIIFKNEIKSAADPAQAWEEKQNLYADTFANPYKAAARGFIDEVIQPYDTRRKIIRSLDLLANKKINPIAKKHGNIPL